MMSVALDARRSTLFAPYSLRGQVATTVAVALGMLDEIEGVSVQLLQGFVAFAVYCRSRS